MGSPSLDAVATAAADFAATKQITHKNNWISVISQFQSGGGGGQVRGTKRDRAAHDVPAVASRWEILSAGDR